MCVAGEFGFELEQGEVAAFQPGGTFFAADLHFRRLAGEHGGAADDRAQRAVFETQRGHGGVFDFDAFVGQAIGVRSQFDDRAGQPLQQVDLVDRLVHQRAAAVEFPRAAPAAGIVVGLRAVPGDQRVADGQFAEAFLVQRGADGLRSAGRARLEHAAECHAIFLAGGDQGVAALECDFHRLFADHVLLRLGRRDRRFHVRAGGRGDCDDLEAWRFQKLFVVADHDVDAEFLRECVGAFPAAARIGAQQPAAVHRLNRARVKISDRTQTHDSKPATGSQCHAKCSQFE